ncbi:MAG TPA: dihydroorotate dehydrogenase [bacterium]|nr:dihydroorotate dehydrogenase [bacterium]
MKRPNMSVDLGRGLRLTNPVMAASGTYGYGLEYEDLTDLSAIGAVVVKGISPLPRAGNKPPRIVETAAGMLNSIGLQNPGIENFLTQKLPRLRDLGATVVANVYGESDDDYLLVVEQLSSPRGDGVSGLEINVSCPNVKAGGLVYGTQPDMLGALVEKIRRTTDKHMMVKLSPNITDITAMARVAVEAGADSLSAINTLLGIAMDLETGTPKLGNVTGGLSGPAIKPVALHLAWRTARAVEVPVVGIGGIDNGRDALEFIRVGCRAVQVGTANFRDPRAPLLIAHEMEEWLAKREVADLADLVGTFRA